MHPSLNIKPTAFPDNLLVWVLAPSVETNDPNIDYYYDFSQSIDEYTKAFKELGLAWKWQPVTLKNYKEVTDHIIAESVEYTPLVFNLCDGDEVNGTPGISVLRLLEEKGLMYTGADEYFYDITTSKIPMKELFDAGGVPTPDWENISSNGYKLNGIFKKLGKPVIIKPAISGGSMGVGIRSVVHTKEAFKEQVKLLADGYRGWQLTSGGVIAEQFISGAEYTTLIVGSSEKPQDCIVYPPVERVFHQALPDDEKFLSFDRLWEIYEEENPIGNYEDFFTYQAPDAGVSDEISKISLEAYCAVSGKGYGRIDIRRDKSSGKLFVLEVNAQCGLSEDEDFTSIGAILRLCGKPYSALLTEIIRDAINRKTN